jgi:predicted acylesterase/phospholipase RssA
VDLLETRKHRSRFEQLERGVLQAQQSRRFSPLELNQLRYVLNFAKLTVVRAAENAQDVPVVDQIGPHSWKVASLFEARMGRSHVDARGLVHVLPELVEDTQIARSKLETKTPLLRSDLDREIGHRKLVLALGGGGGCGYGYGGVFTLLDRYQLNPSLICGTSIGALIGLYRARRMRHDAAAMLEASKTLAWNKVFAIGNEPSRYGLPATLRLHLRRAIGQFFTNEDGHTMTLAELPVPMHIVVTGLKIGALKHELDYYEHFLDGDGLKAGLLNHSKRVFKLKNIAGVMKEFVSQPDLLQEVVFGRDPLTMASDCIDAAGFSSAIPGLIHYDIHRKDKRMHALLAEIYAEYGITRMIEGGIVNNVPANVGFSSAMEGRLSGHRNVHVVAVDCFAPRVRSPYLWPIQQVVRSNVKKNKPYADLWISLSKTLNPLNLVPSSQQTSEAGRWAMADLGEHIPFLEALFQPILPLERSGD